MRTWGIKLAAALTALLVVSVVPAVAEDPPPSVEIHTDRTSYVAGQTAKVSFTIANAGQNTNLKVVVTLANGTSKVYNDTNVYTDNVPTESVYMYYDTRIDAYVAGASEPSDTVFLPVRVVVGSAVAGYYTRSGSYAVFSNSSQPSFRSATTPPRKYRCIKHEVWREYSSGWRVVGLSACKYENTSGVVTWKWVGTHSPGVHYRVRARFLGDGLNHASSGKLIYFKFK